jgi:hypothetical protein
MMELERMEGDEGGREEGFGLLRGAVVDTRGGFGVRVSLAGVDGSKRGSKKKNNEG